MLRDDYFAAAPPKTTGRERFGDNFSRNLVMRSLGFQRKMARQRLPKSRRFPSRRQSKEPGSAHARVIVSGGGAHNRALMARLATRLERARVEPSDSMGFSPDAKEAVAFALLGYETLRGRAANVSRATGAARRVLLGAIAPHELGELMSAVAAECDACR